jgi:hypothetical protein
MMKSLLMKGKILPDGTENSPYFDSKLTPEDRPLELIPYYDVTGNHFLSSDSKNNDKADAQY